MRRRQDRNITRVALAMACLALASAAVSVHLALRALSTMDEMDQLGAAAFQLGRQSGALKHRGFGEVQ